jgi:hypothetical protein
MTERWGLGTVRPTNPRLKINWEAWARFHPGQLYRSDRRSDFWPPHSSSARTISKKTLDLRIQVTSGGKSAGRRDQATALHGLPLDVELPALPLSEYRILRHAALPFDVAFADLSRAYQRCSGTRFFQGWVAGFRCRREHCKRLYELRGDSERAKSCGEPSMRAAAAVRYHYAVERYALAHAT